MRLTTNHVTHSIADHRKFELRWVDASQPSGVRTATTSCDRFNRRRAATPGHSPELPGAQLQPAGQLQGLPAAAPFHSQPQPHQGGQQAGPHSPGLDLRAVLQANAASSHQGGAPPALLEPTPATQLEGTPQEQP